MAFTREFFDNLEELIAKYQDLYGWKIRPGVTLRAHGQNYSLAGALDRDDQTASFIYYDDEKCIAIPPEVLAKSETDYLEAWPALIVAYGDIEALIFDMSKPKETPGFRVTDQKGN